MKAAEISKWSLGLVVVLASVLQAAPLILNEFNAVSDSKYLDSSDYEGSGKADTRFGRIQGNGKDWFELVVTADHVDVRGWELRWFEDETANPGGTVWDSSRSGKKQGAITFTDDTLWSDLRQGTIITIAEEETITAEDSSIVVDGSDTSTNFRQDDEGDWWIHIYLGDSDYLSYETNDGADGGMMSVGNHDWELRVYDGSSDIFGPIGEAISGWGGGGISSKEIGKVEADPSTSTSISDFNDGTSSTFGEENQWSGGSNVQDFSSLRDWAPIPEPAVLVFLLTGLFGILFRSRRLRIG